MEKLTLEEAINELNDRIESAEYADSDYVDCVSVNALKMVVSAINVSSVGVGDTISRRAAINAVYESSVGRQMIKGHKDLITILKGLPSVQPEEVIPHQNYKYLSDYWCACGWHLGKKGEVKYCADCGRKVNWDE